MNIVISPKNGVELDHASSVIIHATLQGASAVTLAEGALLDYDSTNGYFSSATAVDPTGVLLEAVTTVANTEAEVSVLIFGRVNKARLSNMASINQSAIIAAKQNGIVIEEVIE